MATSYSRFDTNSITGLMTVYFRNGTVATFNKAISVAAFKAVTVAPTSYFSWFTLNTYADGTKEYIYADFYTITVGPTPNKPNDYLTNYNYQLIMNTGLVSSYENRTTLQKTSTYRNGSVALFKSGVFSSWIVNINATWIWCDKTVFNDWIDYPCTNGTTLRISKPLVASATPTAADKFKAATYFGYMEL